MPEPARAVDVDDGGVDEIARSYLRLARGDARVALRAVVRDALALQEGRARALSEHIRLISRGYVRAGLDA